MTKKRDYTPKKKPNFFYRLWRFMFYGMLLLGLLFIILKIVGWFTPLPFSPMSIVPGGGDTTATAGVTDCADVSTEDLSVVESGAIQTDCEFRSSEDTYIGFIYGSTFYAKEIEYAVVDNLPLFEGDIILNVDYFKPMENGLMIKGDTYRWPDGIVAYEISDRLPAQARIHDAIAHWEANTSIRFVARTASNASQYPNYIFFQPGLGCSSYVGMVGGSQPINLAAGCTTGNTIHEIGHAVGLWHEQSRADRDQHVTIHYENIMTFYAFNFDQRINDGDDIGDYDYGSIMHYPRWAFSKNGKDTIVPHRNVEIGQRLALSDLDIAAVEDIYAPVITSPR